MKKIVLLTVIQSLIFSAPLYAWEYPWEKTERLEMEKERKEERQKELEHVTPCTNAISASDISSNPATLQFQNFGYTKTEGGYLVKLHIKDLDYPRGGSGIWNCYLNNENQVISLKRGF